MAEKKRFVLETQMRAGTHYICSALLIAYHPYLHYPLRDGGVRQLEWTDIESGLKEYKRVEINTNLDIEILFKHYYHQLEIDPIFSSAKKFALIGYPFDSFYSDGVVFSSDHYSPAPSNRRKAASEYQFRYGSKEWDFLFPYMLKNAEWLEKLNSQTGGAELLVIRYEDLIDNFIEAKKQITEFMQLELVGEFTKPMNNRNRIFWNKNYVKRIDNKALRTMYEIFEKSIDKFYPDQNTYLRHLIKGL